MLDFLKLLLLALTLSISSCDQKQNSDAQSPLLAQLNTEEASAFDSAKVTTVKDRSTTDSIRIIDLHYKEYKYEVESTFSSDSLSANNANLFYPTVLQQKFRIYRSDTLRKAFEFQFKRIKQELVTGDSVEMPDNILCSLAIVPTSRGVLFLILGYGGCNSCSEFSGLYT